MRAIVSCSRGAAFFLAVGIWTMHFIGMLAAPLPPSTAYLVLPTIISFLICALVVGVSLFFVSIGEPTWPRLAGSAVLLGVGICSMHYVGMHGLSGPFEMQHDPLFVTLSVVIAIGTAYGGLRAFLARQGGIQLVLQRGGVRHRGVRHALHRHGRFASGAVEPGHAPSHGWPRGVAADPVHRGGGALFCRRGRFPAAAGAGSASQDGGPRHGGGGTRWRAFGVRRAGA